MFVYLFWSIILIFSYIFVQVNGHMIVYNQVGLRWTKWRRLNNMVSSQHSTALTIAYHSFKIVCRLFYLSFIQYMNSSMIKLGRNKYLITYVINGKMYKMIVIPRRGPAPVLQVIDTDVQEDVSDEVMPYMGPRYDWHNSDISFDDVFSREKLVFELANGEEHECKTSKEQREK